MSPVLQEDSEHYQGPRDYTRDPAFIQASPEDKHKFLMAMDPEYAQDKPQNQQAFIRSMTPNNPSGHSFGRDTTVPITAANGRPYQGTSMEAKLRDWSGPVAKILASALAAQGAGAATGAAGGGGALQAGARSAGAGAVSGATEPGNFGDKLAAAGRGTAWGLGGETATRVGNAVATAPSVGRFLGRMRAEPGVPEVPAGPPSNPVTGTAVLHDLGSQQPAGSPFAPRPSLLSPSGQAEGVTNTPAVDRLLAQHNIPPSGVPAKDLLVTRSPNAGTPAVPAVPESPLNRILRSGAPAGVAQDENAQSGMMLAGKALWDALQGVGYKLGIGRDPNHTGGG